MRKYSFLFYLFCLIYLISISPVRATSPTHPVLGVQQHGKVDPASVEKSLSETVIQPLSATKGLIVPVLSQDVDLSQAKRYKFVLKQVNFTGNTVITSQKLQEIYKKYYNKKISLAKILDLTNQTTNYYREQGYILSQAYLPAQDIDKDHGIITIGIVEGYIDNVTIASDGDGASESLPYSTKLLLRQYGENMMAEKPITQATLERYALLAQDLPGSNIKIVFSPSHNQTGATNVEFIVEHTSLFALEGFYNNRGTRILGPREYSASIHQYNGLYGNETSYSATRDDHNDLRFYSFHHKQPINSNGLNLLISGYQTETDADFKNLRQAIRSVLKTPGESQNLALGFEYPIIRSRIQNLYINSKLDGTDSKTKFNGAEGGVLFKEKIRALRTGLIYDWLDPYFFNILGISLFSVEYSQGLSIMNSYLKPDRATRPNTRKNFSKLNFIFSRSQPLFNNFNLRLLGLGQYAFDELLSSEEFGFGGRIMGLGYDAYEISGDHGVSGKAELAYSIPVNNFLGIDINNIIKFKPEIYGFIDYGNIWNIDYKTSGQKKYNDAASSGFGIRGNIFKYISFDGYIVKPMTRQVQNEGDRKPRYFFSVGAKMH